MSEKIIKIRDEEAIAEVEKNLKVIEPILSLKVNSAPTYEKASDAMKQLRLAKNFLKEKKASVLDPLKLAVENIKALFDPSERKVTEVEDYLKTQIDVYAKKLREEEAQKLKQAQKDIDEGKPIEEATSKLEKTQEKIEKIPMRTYWIVDVVDFSKVPDDYKILDESKAKKAAGAGLKVEGLAFRSEERTINAF